MEEESSRNQQWSCVSYRNEGCRSCAWSPLLVVASFYVSLAVDGWLSKLTSKLWKGRCYCD